MAPLDTRTWRLCERQQCREPGVPAATDQHRSRLWLLGFKADPVRISALRMLLSRKATRDVSLASDEDVLDAIVELLAHGRLHVHAAPPKLLPKAVPREEQPPPPIPVERTPQRPVLSLRMPAIEPPTFPSNVNLRSLASTLVAAAAGGAPFCPLCR